MNKIICDDLNGMKRHGKSVKVKVGGIFTSVGHKGAPFLCDTNLQALEKSSLFSRF